MIDADEVARVVVEPGRPAYQSWSRPSGRDPLPSSGQGLPAIDRGRLAARVFTDPAARAQLNAITHPEIGSESARRGAERRPLVVMRRRCSRRKSVVSWLRWAVLVVDIPEALQLARAVGPRLIARTSRGLAALADLARARRAAANWILDNQGRRSGAATGGRCPYPELVDGVIPPRGR